MELALLCFVDHGHERNLPNRMGTTGVVKRWMRLRHFRSSALVALAYGPLCT